MNTIPGSEYAATALSHALKARKQALRPNLFAAWGQAVMNYGKPITEFLDPHTFVTGRWAYSKRMAMLKRELINAAAKHMSAVDVEQVKLFCAKISRSKKGRKAAIFGETAPTYTPVGNVTRNALAFK